MLLNKRISIGYFVRSARVVICKKMKLISRDYELICNGYYLIWQLGLNLQVLLGLAGIHNFSNTTPQILIYAATLKQLQTPDPKLQTNPQPLTAFNNLKQ